jgi:hypothetical protein
MKMELNPEERELIRMAINTVNWPGTMVEQVVELKKRFPAPPKKDDGLNSSEDK